MDENKKLLLAALVVMLGGNASGIINQLDSPNNFTELEASVLKAEMIEKHHELETRIQRLEWAAAYRGKSK